MKKATKCVPILQKEADIVETLQQRNRAAKEGLLEM